jgi:TRAP transporter 4TM/12TM fusion protein
MWRRVEKMKKPLDYAIIAIGVGTVVLQMVAVRYLFQTFNELKVMHICLALITLTLVAVKGAIDAEKRPRLSVALGSLVIAVSVGILVYLKVNYFRLIQQGDPTTWDMVVGILLIIPCLEFTRRFFGKTLVILALVFIAYAFWGYFLPHPFLTGPFELPYLIDKFAVGFNGALGFILGISVKYVFLFVVFGSLLLATGAHRFLFYIALRLSRGLRSGPIQAAIIPSMLMGTVTGVASANIFITGSFSIPLMKRVGLTPDQAGAYEVSASTAGQIMPPIMGAAAFIMADFTNTPYIRIALLAFIPAILFYISLAAYGHLTALKRDVRVTKEDIESVGFGGTLATAHLFIVPLAVIIVIMAMEFTPSLAIFFGILSLLFLSLLRKETRLSLKGYAQALTDGAILGFRVSVLLSVIGVIVSIVIFTGLGVKLGYFAAAVMGDNLAAMLFTVMIASVILGMGVPTAAAYILVAFITAPILIDAGISIYAAHFFAFYYAVFSLVTPPVAPAAAFGAAIAGGNFWRTALESSKLSVAGFLVPFLFILFPPLLLDFSQTTTLEVFLGALTCLLLIFSLQVAFVGHYFTHCNPLYRIAALGSCALLVFYLVTHSIIYFVVGVVIFLLLTGFQFRASRARASP